tara:strand:+ start:1946 stop:6874 length:4929 start_codon:yes stop_codon:yes gene_type:complete
MAEFKNVFIKSKMNKDLDDRLLPQGEYRDALNIQVSKSESSDVGALENVLGNKGLIDFASVTDNNNIVCIGYLVSEVNSCVFFFLTDNTKTSNTSGRYDPAAEHFIVRSVISQGSATQNSILVKGAFLNFYEGAPVYGVNLIEELLFWTDNRNQPRKINVDSALSDVDYYVIEDTISVAKYMPYTAPILWEKITNVMAANFNPPFTGLGAGEYQTTMKDVVSEKYPDGSPVGATDFQPYYDDTYRGDPDYLEDRFARFSYRFKFDDGEYSLFAPFTQECFIPKQDGYFLFPDQNSLAAGADIDNNDMSASYRSTVVDFMENKVNELTLLIEMPKCGDPALPATSINNVASQFKITEVEILYKESDGAAVMVVDTVKLEANPFFKVTNNVLSYTYSGTKPFRTLPEDQLTRVYDKVPVRALGQEIISNRIVYSNFQTKHTPPANLDYNVGTQPKLDFNVTAVNPTQWATSIVEYPNHTLKQNRNYQAGFVLSDRFGRTTSTILSNAGEGAIAGQLSTVYSPYNEPGTDIGVWPGDSLFVQVNETINEVPIAPTLYPGTYVGDPTLDGYNPLGFETWKVVVKQQEQDYYNVYLPGILASYPTVENQAVPVYKELGLTSHVVLFNDNINKVPRDLAEVGPDQQQFRSSVRLFGRVQNTATSTTINLTNIGLVNEQYYPSRFADTVSTIQDEVGLFNLDTSSGIPPNDVEIYEGAFYEAQSNPSIGRISTVKKIGQTNPKAPLPALSYSIQNLAVYETEPVESKLDIYWETSTSGTIEDLNEQVELTGGQTIFEIFNFDWYLSEYFGVLDTTVAWDPATLGSPELGPGPVADFNNGYSGRFRSVICGESGPTSEDGSFYFKKFNGDPIQNVVLEGFTVLDGDGTDVTLNFDILQIYGTLSVVPGAGQYVNYLGNNSPAVAHEQDSFILVNKAHRVWLTSNGGANEFNVQIRVSDLDNPITPAPVKEFNFPNSTVQDLVLTDINTIHVGGKQLIGSAPLVTWGQNTIPIEDFVLPFPNLPGCTTGFCPGLFYEYGYEEGLTNFDLVKFYGMNGANKNTNGGISVAQPNQETLQWSIAFQQQPFTDDTDPSNVNIFEINQTTGVLKEVTEGTGFGLYALRIQLISGDNSEIAYFDIKITIGRKTADGSFDNNLRGIELQYDNSYIFNLHNTLGAQGNFGAYDDLPGGPASDAQTTFKKVYPSITGIYNQGPTLNEFYRNASNGSYVYANIPQFYQGLNLLQPSTISLSEGALTQGTGYINIEMILAGLGTGDQQHVFQTSQVSWAVEYREVVGGVITSGWKAATDIEGNILSWNSSLAGSTQINPQQSGLKIDGTGGGPLSPAQTSNATHNAAKPSNTGAGDQRQIFGAGSNEITGTLPGQINDNPANTVQYRAERSSNSQSQTTALIGKWAVVGESPIYQTTPCFGEYRVIIQNIGGECDTCQSKIVGDNPNFQNQDENDGRTSQDAGVINMGDFYYDLKPLNAPRGYGYYVDLNTYDNNAQGLEDALDNDMFDPLKAGVEILYAEEGVNRYVSQFYVDAGLTQIVTNATTPAWDNGTSSAPRYVSYTAVETGDSNYNVPYSVNVPDINNPPPPEDARTPNLAAENAATYDGDSGSEQYKRLWACKIDTSTGRKEAKSSVGRAPATP